MTLFRTLLFIFSCTFLLTSCKINQRKNGEKTGRWIYKDHVSNEIIISKGRYKHDFEKGTWKEFNNKNLISQKKYKNGICQTTEYHFNGNKRAEGISKLELEGKNLHWYLFGEWKFYDEAGKYLGSEFYEKSIPELKEMKF